VYPTDSATDDAIASGKTKTCQLVDFYASPTPLHCWDWWGSRTYPGTDDLDGSTADLTYESMEGRITVDRAIRQAASLGGEPLRMMLDGSRSGDDADFVGRLVDSDWHQCRVRVRQVMLDFATEALHSLPMWEWRGLLDHQELTLMPGQPSLWAATCQGGLFRVRGRRLRTRSHEDQQRRDAGDDFYKGTAGMVGVPLNFGKQQGNVVGAAAAPSVGGTYAGGGPLTNAAVNSLYRGR
jgi:hypothetical protein